MRRCVRCEINKAIDHEYVCGECLEWLCDEYNVSEEEDPLENDAIVQVIWSYREMQKRNKSLGVKK